MIIRKALPKRPTLFCSLFPGPREGGGGGRDPYYTHICPRASARAHYGPCANPTPKVRMAHGFNARARTRTCAQAHDHAHAQHMRTHNTRAHARLRARAPRTRTCARTTRACPRSRAPRPPRARTCANLSLPCEVEGGTRAVWKPGEVRDPSHRAKKKNLKNKL
jgi:hypothetical protein